MPALIKIEPRQNPLPLRNQNNCNSKLNQDSLNSSSHISNHISQCSDAKHNSHNENNDHHQSNTIPNTLSSKSSPQTVQAQKTDRTRTEQQQVPHFASSEYYTIPSTEDLKSMAAEQLKQVENFTICHKEYGKIMWPGPTDLTKLDLVLDEIIEIDKGSICVYPTAAAMPAIGFGLNKDQEITLTHIRPIDKEGNVLAAPTKAKLDKYERKLRTKPGKYMSGYKFKDYNPQEGIWTFTVENAIMK